MPTPNTRTFPVARHDREAAGQQHDALRAGPAVTAGMLAAKPSFANVHAVSEHSVAGRRTA
jgi:hypothetical protein